MPIRLAWLLPMPGKDPGKVKVSLARVLEIPAADCECCLSLRLRGDVG